MRLKTLGLAAALALAVPAASSAEDFTVTLVAGHPPVFRWVRMMPEAFIPTVTAELAKHGHSVTFSEQYGGALAKVGDELETVEAGLAEIGSCQALFDPAKLAVQNVTYYTPFVSSDVRLVGQVIDKLHADEPAMTQAYGENGVVYIGAPITIDDYMLMTNFPVTSLADLQGRKIAAPGAAINWLSGTGAVGVAGNLTTYYNEIKTGVYDGVLVFASAALPGKLYEVAPYITRFGLGAQYAGSLCANKDWWDGLPEEARAAFIAGSKAAQEWYHRTGEGRDRRARQDGRGRGDHHRGLGRDAHGLGQGHGQCREEMGRRAGRAGQARLAYPEHLHGGDARRRRQAAARLGQGIRAPSPLTPSPSPRGRGLPRASSPPARPSPLGGEGLG
ncbi:C4-dicarboxylate TRAP transporter substrate-binding protein [Seohaeicola zhoushanensis]